MVDKTKMLEEMKLGVGSSESAILLLGRNYGMSIEDLFSVKCELAQRKNIDDAPDVQRGNYLEEVALQMFCKEYNVEVTHTGANQHFWHDKKNAMLAHTDGLVGVIVPTEVKCPRSSVFYSVIDNGVPFNHQIQVQHQMHLTGAEFAYIIYFNADGWVIHVVEVPRNQEIIDIIKERCRLFWEGVQDKRLVTFEPIREFEPIGNKSKEWECDALWHLKDALVRKSQVEFEIDVRKNEILDQWPEDTKKVHGLYGSISLTQNKKTGKLSLRTNFKKEE